jgi:8-oxo-dGTP diphosphatase
VPFTYPYPRPAVTCDTVVFTMRADDLAVLLIQRKAEPFKGRWALPGGFVNENEALERAALRELEEETGLSGVRLEQLGTFGDPGRDPRGHTVTVAYMTFLVAEAAIMAGDDAASASFLPFRSLALGRARASISPPAKKAALPKRASARAGAARSVELAFDHAKIVAKAYRRLCQHLDDPIRNRAFELLPSRFTIAELQRFYEVVLGKSLEARAFKRRLLEQRLVLAASAAPTKKPAEQLYHWNRVR